MEELKDYPHELGRLSGVTHRLATEIHEINERLEIADTTGVRACVTSLSEIAGQLYGISQTLQLISVEAKKDRPD